MIPAPRLRRRVGAIPVPISVPTRAPIGRPTHAPAAPR